jgi:HAMP domain-containing protein
VSDIRIDPRLKSQRFRQEREADWRRLERLMDRVEKGSASALTDDEILAIPVLYRSTLSALSVARATSLDRGLVAYLETLSSRAYFFVYGARGSLRAKLAEFFAGGWPAAVRGLWRETLVSALLMTLGALAAAWLVGQEADWYYAFMPPEMSGGRDPAASTAALKATLAGKAGSDGPLPHPRLPPSVPCFARCRGGTSWQRSRERHRRPRHRRRRRRPRSRAARGGRGR